MKKIYRITFIALLALVLVFCLALVSCGGGANNNTPGGETPGGETPGGTPPVSRFRGTWNATVMGITLSIVATDTTWDYYAYGSLCEKGTYTVSGNTITAVTTEVIFGTGRVGNVGTLTLVNDNTIYENSTGYTYTKVN